MTGAVAAAPSVGEPAHHPLDRMGFYGFGQTLKPAVCEKCHNPKNSKNTCTDATTADDCGVMSLGHSPVGGGVMWNTKSSFLLSRHSVLLPLARLLQFRLWVASCALMPRLEWGQHQEWQTCLLRSHQIPFQDGSLCGDHRLRGLFWEARAPSTPAHAQAPRGGSELKMTPLRATPQEFRIQYCDQRDLDVSSAQASAGISI